ncbi:MAG: hypothetical protein FWD17_02710 [Polyangiaceae bacterium]|nr:hypothetical protein [Polyangiaceae bacterium]
MAVVAMAWAASSCAPTAFAGQEILAGVRILATSAEPSFAQPGEVVHLQLLAYDARSPADRADAGLRVDWLAGCRDPANDAYFACFPPLSPGEIFGVDGDAGFADAGAPPSDGGAAGCPGLADDAGIAVPLIAQASFTMPPEAVTAHPVTPGATPYGLAFIFNIACAGDAGLLPISPGNINPQQIPFTCYDPAGNIRSPDEWVLGYSRVYAYAPDAGPDGGAVRNQNPVIDGIDLSGAASPPCFSGAAPSYVAAPITIPPCVGGSCPVVQIGPILAADSQETNPVTGLREAVWVDYYTTFGTLSGPTRLLADPTAGLITIRDKIDTKFQAPVPGPNDPHAGYLFLVVHDDRGGVSWVTVPVQLSQ